MFVVVSHWNFRQKFLIVNVWVCVWECLDVTECELIIFWRIIEYENNWLRFNLKCCVALVRQQCVLGTYFKWKYTIFTDKKVRKNKERDEKFRAGQISNDFCKLLTTNRFNNWAPICREIVKTFLKDFHYNIFLMNSCDNQTDNWEKKWRKTRKKKYWTFISILLELIFHLMNKHIRPNNFETIKVLSLSPSDASFVLWKFHYQQLESLSFLLYSNEMIWK